MDRLIHGTAANDTVRVVAAVGTKTVEDVVARHGLSPTATAALGRTLIGAALLGATQKDFDRLTIKIESDGPIGGVVAEARPDGALRGYVKNAFAEVPPNGNGKFDVGGAVGSGMFFVIRESGFALGLHNAPYIGSVPIQTGEIGDDLAFYLAKSEQIPSAVLLGVLLKNSAPYVAAAGGVLVQMLPGANEHIITMIEDTISHAPHLTTVIDGGAGPDELVEMVLGEIEFKKLGEKEIRFECTCSQEKALTMIEALGAADAREMLEEDGGASMACGFCGADYQVSKEELAAIVARLS
ncbi:MAG: disulfide bond chaperone [Acidobacteria bacterium OLB17]|nr:MAG: disulfide bond chaperone [Acidobacteria bacterium OLB17]MCZ2390051.1 Hsp33 family molecular chaperone HslO [Acidobacteriota bacterium]